MTSITNHLNWRSFDVETSGERMEYALQPWSEHGWMTSFASARGYERAEQKYRIVSNVYLRNSDEYTRLSPAQMDVVLRKYLANWLQMVITEKFIVVGWNVAFDIAWIIKMGFRDKVMQIRWLDAMNMWKKLTRVPESHIPQPMRKKYGLKLAVEEFYPQMAGYEEGIDFRSMKPEDIDKRLGYNKKDAHVTLLLARMFMRELSAPGRERQLKNFLVECSCLPLVADSYITGLSIDSEECASLGGRLAIERITLKVELEARGATEEVLASPAQLGKLLYDEWKLPVLKKTKKGARSTDKEALYELSFMDDRANMIQRYREIGGLKTKFVDNILASCQYNEMDVSHPTANVDSTYTGRMTFSSHIGRNKAKRQTGFALHQTKRAAEFRRPITAPEGYLMVEWDAAGQEYRWVAIESMDEVMLAMCQPGEDAHSYMAAQMTDYTYPQLRAAYKANEPGAYETRMAGKVGNLSCQYRIGWQSLLSTARVQYELPWDAAMAQHVHAAYRKTYTGVPKYWDRKILEAQRQGYAETLAGRRVLLAGDWRGQDKWRLESSAINFPIQGVGADQKYLAMAAIKSLLTKYDGKFYFELHDGLYAIFPLAKAEKAAHEGRRMLSNLPYAKVWGFTPPIPLPWDMKLGPNWGDLKEVSA